jgi:hypothetical protein
MPMRSVATAAMLVIFTHLGANPQGGNGVPLTAAFRCPSTPECLSFSTDAIQGDSIPYNAANGADVSFDVSGDFTFKIPGTNPRYVFVNLSNPAGSTTAPFATEPVSSNAATAFSSPLDASGRQLRNGFDDISVGQTARATFRVSFPDPDGRAVSWSVWFAPNQYPSSQLVTATRISSNTWSVEAKPTTDPTTGETAGLTSTSTSRGKTVTTYWGTYYVPFKITFNK